MRVGPIRLCLMVCGLVVGCEAERGIAQKSAEGGKSSTHPATAGRDGQHDFDFEIGIWKSRLRRLVRPLTGSTTWVEMDGTSVVRKVWNGRANLLELEVDGGGGHLEGLSLRLYNPESHQWSLNFANSGDGALSQPTIGGFKDGRGEFFDQETLNGRAIFVRFVISDITPNSCRFEQAFSKDGGKTWEVNWIATDTRLQGGSEKSSGPAATVPDGQHDFDFEVGNWNIHLKRLKDRLAGSTDWGAFDGSSVTRKVLGGRADLEEFETDSPGGCDLEGLTMRLFNSQCRHCELAL